MRPTKLGHACVRLEKDGMTLVVDPGSFSAADALEGAHAVPITHEHVDHVVTDRLGFLVDGLVFHPRDAFTLPAQPVDTLLVPVHAPWSKVAEVIDYVRAVKPRQVIPIHDGLLNDVGLALVDRLLGECGPGIDRTGVTLQSTTPLWQRFGMGPVGDRRVQEGPREPASRSYATSPDVPGLGWLTRMAPCTT